MLWLINVVVVMVVTVMLARLTSPVTTTSTPSQYTLTVLCAYNYCIS